MMLLILRVVFACVAAGVATLLLTTFLNEPGLSFLPWILFLLTIALAGGVVAIDMMLPKKPIELISAVYFGLVVGIFLTYVLMLMLTPLLPSMEEGHWAVIFRQSVPLMIGMAVCYLCISLLIQTKDDFRFIIPYVEFSKEVKGLKPYILDTSVVIDGRIADLVETNVLDNQLVMPRFVLSELQGVADSADKLRRARGRRGLDILNRLRNNQDIDLKIYDRELPEMDGQAVDMKLVLLAKHMEGKIVTGDYNLNKVARLHNVAVINLNDIANSLKPVFLPGESFNVRIVKPGEEMGQGIGYLDDGTMIVVEGGREHIGKEVKVNVTSVLQTSAGRMIFGKYAA
ncbi:MAG TPA: TRAM domain-containing protein [Pirellulaceae bacterium]